jgi:hypothetical protein
MSHSISVLSFETESDGLIEAGGSHSISRDGAPFVSPLSAARIRTMIVVNAASVLEKTDEQMLPSVYKYVNCSFNASPGAQPMIASAALSRYCRRASGLALHRAVTARSLQDSGYVVDDAVGGQRWDPSG